MAFKIVSIHIDKMRKTMGLHKQSLKTVVPFLFTFANAAFGFFSIVKTLEGNFISAAFCIIIAAFMDFCDGRLARYLGTSGQLGSELDSLCDAVSFCLAPAVLMYGWYLHDFGNVGFFASALVLYICAGLLRLARFNILTTDQSRFFLGLPTTVAAFFFAQLVLYQELVMENALQTVLNEKVMVGLVTFIALLMISTIRFPAFKKMHIPWKNATTYVKGLLLCSITFWCALHGYPIIFLIVSCYIIGSLCFNGWTKIRSFLFTNND